MCPPSTPPAGSLLLDDTKMMAMQMGMMPGMAGAAGGPQQWAAKSAYTGEASALGVTRYTSSLLRTERELLVAARGAVARARAA